MRPKWKLLAAGWLLVLAGSALALAVQTSGGIDVQDVRFDTEEGERLSALLYVPESATPEAPAPAVLAVHGYINSRETQSAFAIELARRGYVVLALDQTGHGFSGGTAGSEGYGGPAGLRYLRELPFVDPANIGLEGHSMGGWAVLAAASAYPEGYRSVVLVGSATGPGFAEVGTPTYPRNLGVVFSRYDEFSQMMWGVPNAADVTASTKLKGVFGTEADVEAGRAYGSTRDGTARWLAVPNTTHPGEHLSRQAIGYAVHWLNVTLDGEREMAVEDQIWFWKEAGTLVALLGGVLLLLGAFELFLSLQRFAPLAERGVGVVDRGDAQWWLTLAAASVIPAVSYFPLTNWGSVLAANPVLPQEITNQILVWALVNGLIVLPALSLRGGMREHAAASKALVALLSIASAYGAMLVAHFLFTSDFRFWVVALKPLTWSDVPMFLAYCVPFTAFFYVTQRALQRTLALREASRLGQYATGIGAAAGGFTAMVGALYMGLFATGHLPSVLGADALWTVIAIQFVPILALTGFISVFAWRRTNGALAGALMCGWLVTWYIVAGQATHA